MSRLQSPTHDRARDAAPLLAVARPLGRELAGWGPRHLERGTSDAYARWVKRAFSLATVALALPFALALAAPIAVVNAILFRSPRRIFFHQERVGLDGRVFRIWKFRTMHAPEARGVFHSWKSGLDRQRVTRFGRWLRNTHLDELPQLFNVALGDMDLVGPRPEMVEIHDWARARIPSFSKRNAVRPGITGLAQTTLGYAGMDERAYANKLATDLSYIRRQSLPEDLRILARTFVWMLAGRGWRPARADGHASALEASGLIGPGETLGPGRAGTMGPWKTPSRPGAPDSSPIRRTSNTRRARRIPSGRIA